MLALHVKSHFFHVIIIQYNNGHCLMHNNNYCNQHSENIVLLSNHPSFFLPSSPSILLPPSFPLPPPLLSLFLPPSCSLPPSPCLSARGGRVRRVRGGKEKRERPRSCWIRWAMATEMREINKAICLSLISFMTVRDKTLYIWMYSAKSDTRNWSRCIGRVKAICKKKKANAALL